MSDTQYEVDQATLEMDQLRAETDALVHEANRIEQAHEITRDELAEAHDRGQTYEEYRAERGRDLDEAELAEEQAAERFAEPGYCWEPGLDDADDDDDADGW